MTLPSIIQNYQRKALETQFKAAHSIISQALLNTQRELEVPSLYDEYTALDRSTGEYYKAQTYIDAFYKQLRVVKNLSVEEIPEYSIYSDRRIKYKASNRSYSVTYPDAVLPNGMTIKTAVQGSMTGKKILFIVDINGIKKPNRYGHDLFSFSIMSSDDKLVGGKKTRDYTEEELKELNSEFNDLLGVPCSRNSKQAVNGAGCTWYAINNICPDDSSKGYWDCLPR